MTVRSADPALRDRYVAIYVGARRFMAANGNPEQWRDKDFALDVDLDLASGALCEGRNEAGELLGVFAFLEGPDPTYQVIDGAWLDDSPYRVLHRVASSFREPGDRMGGTDLPAPADRHPPRQSPDATGAESRGLYALRDHPPCKRRTAHRVRAGRYAKGQITDPKTACRVRRAVFAGPLPRSCAPYFARSRAVCRALQGGRRRHHC